SSPQNTVFPPCQFARQAALPTHSISQVLKGDFIFGDKKERNRFGRFNWSSQVRSDIANIDLIFGWNFYQDMSTQLGVYIVGVAPTARAVCEGSHIFVPVNGPDKHWELGAGAQLFSTVWECGDDHTINIYAEAYARHMFKRCHRRSFDLKDRGCFSRFLLLKEFNQQGFYTGTLIPAVDTTTRPVNVTIDVEGEAVVQALYKHNCLSAGVGYNFYGRSHEKLCLRNVKQCCNDRHCYGIQGCTGVCASNFIPGSGLTGQGTTLNATQSKATITSCGSVDNAVSLGNPAIQGQTVGLAYNSPHQRFTPINRLIVAQDSQIDGKPAPVCITDKDLDISSGASPSYISHTFFGHFTYNLKDWYCSPCIGIGGEIEVADKKRCCSLNRWGIWLKTGLCF
ncbi:MAG TPA: hypothetical protein VHA52_12170, partial [Candidatus Babeliaceae bacterium]|nr:hypothetical protein [Candidatus Babeliaceae bacterium]